jgi:hypothetical protein
MVAVGASVMAWRLTSPRISGPDEGIYLAAARALSRGAGYSQPFLPATLAQTKYPPLYAALLTIPDALVRPGPGDLTPYKVVNAVAFGAVVLLTAIVLARERMPTAWVLAGAALAGTAPALVSFVDLIATDLLFAGFVIALLAIVRSPLTRGQAVVLGAVASLAVLTRLVGVALGIGLVWHLVASSRLKDAWLAIATVTGTCALWWSWRLAAATDVGPLEVYYVAYEPSAWQWLWYRPWHSLELVWTNLITYPTLVPAVFGWPMTWMAIAASGAATYGLRSLDPARRALLVRIALVYAMGTIGHPYAVDRYLLPAVPLAVVGLVRAAGGVRDTLARAALTGLLLLIAAGHVAWLIRYSGRPPQHVHAAFGRPLNFAWDGLAETLTFLRERTSPDAVVAAARESIVHLYANRRAIRPTIHLPETWSYIHERELTAAEAAVIVRAEYRRLGVSYLMISPSLEDVEGRFADAVVEAAGLTLYPVVFTSRDGRHRVYDVGKLP